ncbi:MAG: flagellin, partial [Bryobacteraceae bacterium]
MSFDINTNIASLQAQNYLRTNSAFQSKTINKVTSGLRIVQSGDDAAGLAIANGYRSDEAVLTQGIQNANSGLSQLQIIDGGMSNISQLLDRARTLATESATGTFTGDRGVLNSEFQNVLTEIDRQSQAVGMNTGGTFAKNLSVFVGGGKGTSGAATITNGSVSLNLSQATVDAKSLGLKGVQAAGMTGTDIGAGSSSTSVAKILADTNNQKAVAGYTNFVINGPGFSGANAITVQVNLSGVTDADTLVTAVNTAIQSAGNGPTQGATAFKNANITAAVNTDVNGKQQLTFGSSSTALQVSAGDQMANALMGNFGAKAVMTGTDVTNTYTTTGSSDDYLALSFNGGPVMNFHIGTVTGITAGTVASDLNAISSFSANAVATADATTHKITITSANDNPNSTITVSASTLATSLGLSGTATATATTGKSLAQSVTVNEGATGTSSLVGAIVRFSGGGLASPVSITLGSTATTYALAQTDLVNQVTANATLKAAGISVTAGATSLTFSSNLGQNFSVSASGDTNNSIGLGNYKTGANSAFDYTTITGGVSATGVLTDKLEISV